MINKKTFLAILLIALLFSFIAYMISDEALNQEIAFEIIPNNTNLAPDAGAPHPFGTGERLDNVTYTATNYSIEIHAFAHASSVSSTAGTFLYINDTLVSSRSGRPLGSAESAFRGVDTTIPKGATYRVDFENYHHYEWREYPILSGRNGTLSLNQSIFNTYNTIGVTNESVNPHNMNGSNITSGIIPQARLDGYYVNKTGDNVSGLLILGGNTTSTDRIQSHGRLAIIYDSGQNTFGLGLDIYKIGNGSSKTGSMNASEEIGYHNFYGWDGTAYSRSGYAISRTTEKWTPTAQGSSYAIATTKIGTTGATVDVLFKQSNMTLSGSCIQMKNTTGTNYRLEIIGSTLTTTVGTC